MTDSKTKAASLFDRVNLLLAICAIVISGASFYATYIQADAAEKQVRAVTWPLLQITTSNATDEGELRVVMRVSNAGVGPAHIKQFSLEYEGERYNNIYPLLWTHFEDESAYLKEEIGKPLDNLKGGLITSSIINAIITPGESRRIFDLKAVERNKALWNALNTARWEMKAHACYCSLLEKCYTTDFKQNPVEVKACKAAN